MKPEDDPTAHQESICVGFLIVAAHQAGRVITSISGYDYEKSSEAGHLCQNIYLQAVSLGLGSVSVGAFLDEEVNRLIGIDGKKEAVIYLHPVGNHTPR